MSFGMRDKFYFIFLQSSAIFKENAKRSSHAHATRIIINLSAVSITRNQRRLLRERSANELTTVNPFAALKATSLPLRPDMLFVRWRVMYLPRGVPRVNNGMRRRDVRSSMPKLMQPRNIMSFLLLVGLHDSDRVIDDLKLRPSEKEIFSNFSEKKKN